MTLRFISTHILNKDNPNSHISLSLEDSENLNIVGSSGSGKTSYVNAIMGLPSILNGGIFIDNEDVSNFSYEKWTIIRREKISCVFQNLEIFNDLSIDDNIELVTDLYTNIDRSKIDYLFSSLGLSGLKKNKAKTLSLGEKQKLAICRALVRPFSLIILDEPFSHLDIKNIENVCTVINEITNNNNANIILTSHSKADMLKFHKEIFV